MILLKKFGVGWQERFNAIIEELFKVVPDTLLISEERVHGMLRLKFTSNTELTQYIVDAVSYKIERDSSRICEGCGEWGSRRSEYLPEKKCLCWKCYALEVDAIMSSNTQTQ
jgi:hypothetical protein